MTCDNSLWKYFFPPEEKISEFKTKLEEIKGEPHDSALPLLNQTIELDSEHPLWKYIIIDRFYNPVLLIQGDINYSKR